MLITIIAMAFVLGAILMLALCAAAKRGDQQIDLDDDKQYEWREGP
jgi:hypothetical protein